MSIVTYVNYLLYYNYNIVCSTEGDTMNIINSKANILVKEIRNLSKKKNRDKFGLYIIETKKLLDEAIKSNIEIKTIILREDISDKYDDAVVFSEKLFNSLSNLVTPDGYMAIVYKKEMLDISDKVLILDNLQDPGNMGTLIRSCEAFGFNTIISINSVDYYNEKVLRASMGSNFRLNLIESNYDQLKELLNHKILIADMDGKDFNQIEKLDKIALVIGNEGNGISDDIKKLDHELISIPMQGEIESLNAGVSGSILMSRFS